MKSESWLKQQLEDVKKESDFGEKILVEQVKELRNEKDILHSKYENETILRKRLHN